ncbi:MAG: acetyl-CoA C-acyltransferase [Bdellovibrionaceae bacterium]|nr:acetyl-CoA C-acyltransferase [Pseudobdellovibrionaceae bacterium]
MSEVFIVAAKRTAIGAFQGGLSSIPATTLGAISIKASVEQSGLNPELIQECIMGHVLNAGCGQAPARQAALGGGLSESCQALTINKVCGSGLKAVMLATDSILLGHSQAIVAGGQENMSLSPHLLEKSRLGFRMGPATMTDSMIKDGLWDPYNNFHMGNAAELCVTKYKISRQEQDDFAKQSYEWAQAAQTKGYFKKELCPVEVKQRKGSSIVEEDEEPKKAKLEKISSLRPAFDKDGSITAANASKLNDGAASFVLASQDCVSKQNLKPLAKIISQASFAQDPKWFTTAPVAAMKKALKKANLTINDIDLFEINEAFSVVTMVAIKDLNIPREKVNVHGGAVALGHPIGASGARILNTLVYALKQHNKKYGMASLCIGGGEAVAVIVENI